MGGNSWLPVSTHNTISPSWTLISVNKSRNFVPCLPPRLLKNLTRIQASSANTEQSPQTFSKRKNHLAVIWDIPGSIWRQTLHPLSDFGFGRKSIWEGGVGLYLVSGAVLLALSLVWLKGFNFRSRLRKYQAVFEFAEACGISVGTPVRIRGITVGNVIRVNPSLRSIDAVVEIEDDKTIVPRNSLIELNQSGLLMETFIDITPQDPLPSPTVGPLDPDCGKEELIVCDRQKIVGRQGVSLDVLVGIVTRLGREMEELGLTRTYKLASKVASVIEDTRPLLAKIEIMAEDVRPLLTEVRDSGLMRDVENLTKRLTEATEDLRKVHSSILSPENTELVRQSVLSLILTLKNIESISSDVSGFTSDAATRQNLKLLIRSLSRLL